MVSPSRSGEEKSCAGPSATSGRKAPSPFAIPAAGWKEIATRTWHAAARDNIGLVGAGVSFYGFLALVPLLAAIVLCYGLIAEPATVLKNMQGLTSVMPADAAKLIGEQLMNVVRTSGSKKGFGLLLALALALFGARNGAGSIVTALNIAYEEKETRSFIRLNLIALAITAGSVLVAIMALVAIAALGHLPKLFPHAPGLVLVLGKLLSYAAAALGGAAGAATLYRYAPDRKKARWVWLTPGSLLATTGWLLLTVSFGIYVANFGNYNATYGSLGAVVVMLTWLYLSSYVLLLGAEFNFELEHQTDSDTSPDRSQSPNAVDAKSAGIMAQDDANFAEAPPAPAGAAPGDGRRAGGWRPLKLARGLTRQNRIDAPNILASGGLAMLRRGGQTPAGLAMLAAGGLLAWLVGDRSAGFGPRRS